MHEVATIGENVSLYPDTCLPPPIPFSFFDTGLEESDCDKLGVDRIAPHRTEAYNNFGELENFYAEVQEFFKFIGDNSPELSYKCAKKLDEFIKGMLDEFNKEHPSLEQKGETAWVTIRACKPIPAFDTPRWHMDGGYFEPYGTVKYKIAVTLKGPGTMLCDIPDSKRKDFEELRNKGYDRDDISSSKSMETRSNLDKFLEPFTKFCAKTFEGIKFIVDDSNYAAIHSEPRIDSDRIFMSILPGSKEQIKEWQQKCLKQ